MVSIDVGMWEMGNNILSVPPGQFRSVSTRALKKQDVRLLLWIVFIHGELWDVISSSIKPSALGFLHLVRFGVSHLTQKQKHKKHWKHFLSKQIWVFLRWVCVFLGFLRMKMIVFEGTVVWFDAMLIFRFVKISVEVSDQASFLSKHIHLFKVFSDFDCDIWEV